MIKVIATYWDDCAVKCVLFVLDGFYGLVTLVLINDTCHWVGWRSGEVFHCSFYQDTSCPSLYV
jgi:hypothetical protein